ncbi:MAG: RluA family pseudouridine synthase [Planctomycetes bacterium]|nr:RluA family pseudouridine synthase [Planctomycetota bacterium]
MPPPPVANPALDVHLLMQDEQVMVAAKPAGMPTQPGVGHQRDTLMNALFAQDGRTLERLGHDRDWGLLHRLDRETSGCVIVARTAAAYDGIRRQFERRTISKSYLAIVQGRLPRKDGSCRQPLAETLRGGTKVSVIATAGEPAITHWTTIAAKADHALLSISIETGRLHQIRAHLAWLGAPVLGDRVYRSLLPPNTSALRDKAVTLFLHAHSIAFDHPATGERTTVIMPVPERFSAQADALIGAGWEAHLPQSSSGKGTDERNR